MVCFPAIEILTFKVALSGQKTILSCVSDFECTRSLNMMGRSNRHNWKIILAKGTDFTVPKTLLGATRKALFDWLIEIAPEFVAVG